MKALDDQEPLKVSHVITSLDADGAQQALVRILRVQRNWGIESRVISLSGYGPIADDLCTIGVPVHAVGMHNGRCSLRQFRQLTAMLKNTDPDVVVTWLYHADLLGGLAARGRRRTPVVWNVRHGHFPRDSKRTTRWTATACARLSSVIPNAITFCSKNSMESHVSSGYRSSRCHHVPNGFVVADHEVHDGTAVRKELRVAPQTPLLAHFGRYHPDKDHSTLFRAISILRERNVPFHLLACGRGVSWENDALMKMLKRYQLVQHVSLMGERSDVLRLAQAADMVVSSSRCEGFPNVLGEALSRATPCVATDVGDSRDIVGDAGMMVPAEDPARLATALEDMIRRPASERTAMGLVGRRHLEERFSLPSIAARHAAIWRNAVVDASGREGPPNVRKRDSTVNRSVDRRAA